MNSRLIIVLLTSAAAACVAIGAHAANAAEPAKEAGAKHHSPQHAHAATHSSAAQPSAAQSIGRNAATQARVASDVAHGRLSTSAVAAIESKAALADGATANVLVGRPGPNGNAGIAAAERELAHTVSIGERAHRHQDALERQQVQVATTRDAEQQRLIASGLRSGRLNAVQASELERAQAAIVAAQADLERKGHETVDDALRMQHLQDVQDWAIRSGHEPDSARA